MEKKLKAFLRDSDNDLEKAVIEDILDKGEEMESYLKDVLNHGCQSGIVSGLIYYNDTRAFYIKHMDDISQLCEELTESIGEPLKMETPMYNWLSWFGYEETARAIADKLELEY